MESKQDSLYERLEHEIANGQRRPGSPIPSMRELREQAGVAQNTVVVVLARLEAAGLIERGQGTRSTVRWPRTKIRRDAVSDYLVGARLLDEAPGVAERSAGMSRDAFEIVTRIDEVESTDDLAKAFRCPPNTRLLERHYRWTRKKTEQGDLQLVRSWLPMDIVELCPAIADPNNEPWAGGHLAQLAAAGYKVTDSRDLISARPPLSSEAADLEIGPGVSVITIRRIDEDPTGRVVAVTDSIHPGDRTELVYRIPIAFLDEHGYLSEGT